MSPSGTKLYQQLPCLRLSPPPLPNSTAAVNFLQNSLNTTRKGHNSRAIKTCMEELAILR